MTYQLITKDTPFLNYRYYEMTKPNSPDVGKKLPEGLDINDILALLGIEIEGKTPPFAVVEIPEERRFQGISRLVVVGMEQEQVSEVAASAGTRLNLSYDLAREKPPHELHISPERDPAGRYGDTWLQMIRSSPSCYTADFFRIHLYDSSRPFKQTCRLASENNTIVEYAGDIDGLLEKLSSHESAVFHPQDVTLFVVPHFVAEQLGLPDPDRNMLLIVNSNSFEMEEEKN